jgi:hypothetical protein
MRYRFFTSSALGAAPLCGCILADPADGASVGAVSIRPAPVLPALDAPKIDASLGFVAGTTADGADGDQGRCPWTSPQSAQPSA